MSTLILPKSKSHFRWSFLSTAAAFFPQRGIISNSHVLTMNWKCKRFLQGSTPTYLRSERESGADYPKRFYVMTHRNGISKRGLRLDSFSDFWGNFALCVQCDTLWQKTIFRLKITFCCRIFNWWYKWVKNLTNFKPISKRKVRNKTFLNLDLESRKLVLSFNLS